MTCSTSSAPRRITDPLPSGLRLISLLTLAALAGCGSNGAIAPAADATHKFTGSWGIYATADPTGMPIGLMIGSLAVSNGSVTGTLSGFAGPGSPCVENIQSENVTGTIDAANNVTLTVPLTQGVATITASLSANPNIWIYGFYQIVGGGACAMPSTPMMMAQFAPVTGTYNGTFNLYDSTGTVIPGSAMKVSAVIYQADYPDIHGQFVLSGNVVASGACNDSVALQSGGAVGGIVFGQILTGELDPTSDTISYASFQDLQPQNPNCSQQFEGTLTRQ